MKYFKKATLLEKIGYYINRFLDMWESVLTDKEEDFYV